MHKWLVVATLVGTMSVTGCASSPRPAETQNRDLAAELTKTKEALQAAQEEIRWLHIDLGKRPAFDPPKSAVEAYASALVRRNGATARVYLSQAMRAKLNIPPHGIGISNPHLKRYEILGEKIVGDTFQFQVRLFSEYTGSPEVPGDVEIYTVQSLPDDTGNDAWLITDIRK